MKYSIGTSEGEYQPGSEGRVLKNSLNINSETEMDEAEEALLFKLYDFIFGSKFTVESLAFQDIKDWHRMWLKPIYSWAGELRTVDMSKGDIRFAAALFLPNQIKPFEDKFLSEFGLLSDMENQSLVKYLAASHVEFILTHPFREGNGRISRLLLDVMATQAGYGPMDYSLWDTHKDY